MFGCHAAPVRDAFVFGVLLLVCGQEAALLPTQVHPVRTGSSDPGIDEIESLQDSTEPSPPVAAVTSVFRGFSELKLSFLQQSPWRSRTKDSADEASPGADTVVRMAEKVVGASRPATCYDEGAADIDPRGLGMRARFSTRCGLLSLPAQYHVTAHRLRETWDLDRPEGFSYLATAGGGCIEADNDRVNPDVWGLRRNLQLLTFSSLPEAYVCKADGQRYRDLEPQVFDLVGNGPETKRGRLRNFAAVWPPPGVCHTRAPCPLVVHFHDVAQHGAVHDPVDFRKMFPEGQGFPRYAAFAQGCAGQLGAVLLFPQLLDDETWASDGPGLLQSFVIPLVETQLKESRGVLDASRVGAIGIGEGAFGALHAAARYPDVFSVVVAAEGDGAGLSGAANLDPPGTPLKSKEAAAIAAETNPYSPRPSSWRLNLIVVGLAAPATDESPPETADSAHAQSFAALEDHTDVHSAYPRSRSPKSSKLRSSRNSTQGIRDLDMGAYNSTEPAMSLSSVLVFLSRSGLRGRAALQVHALLGANRSGAAEAVANRWGFAHEALWVGRFSLGSRLWRSGSEELLRIACSLAIMGCFVYGVRMLRSKPSPTLPEGRRAVSEGNPENNLGMAQLTDGDWASLRRLGAHLEVAQNSRFAEHRTKEVSTGLLLLTLMISHWVPRGGGPALDNSSGWLQAFVTSVTTNKEGLSALALFMGLADARRYGSCRLARELAFQAVVLFLLYAVIGLPRVLANSGSFLGDTPTSHRWICLAFAYVKILAHFCVRLGSGERAQGTIISLLVAGMGLLTAPLLQSVPIMVEPPDAIPGSLKPLASIFMEGCVYADMAIVLKLFYFYVLGLCALPPLLACLGHPTLKGMSCCNIAAAFAFCAGNDTLSFWDSPYDFDQPRNWPNYFTDRWYPVRICMEVMFVGLLVLASWGDTWVHVLLSRVGRNFSGTYVLHLYVRPDAEAALWAAGGVFGGGPVAASTGQLGLIVCGPLLYSLTFGGAAQLVVDRCVQAIGSLWESVSPGTPLPANSGDSRWSPAEGRKADSDKGGGTGRFSLPATTGHM
eukprot:TRINITY_DN27075_c0_g2_i1.p1 TRINITY_DN27075_c0_g2~~TRINITY_DN27075_c0_g2_i1.p1  ORF type:complete len:1056 (+),score=141.21 TRINITY_DN27075_c0_g2_i1:87-3254(+)